MKMFKGRKSLVTVLVVTFIILIGILFYQKSLINSFSEKDLFTSNSNKSNTAIISTYGSSVEGSPFYETYITKAMQYILDPKNGVSNMVILGGYTLNRNKSQSQAVLDYINKNFPEVSKKKINIMLDKCGITTSQNITNAKRLLDSKNIKPEKITVFAETSRIKKVYFFANTTFQPFPQEDKQKILNEVEQVIKLPQKDQLKAYNTLQDYYLTKYTTPTELITVITQDSGLPKVHIENEYSQIFQDIAWYLNPAYGDKKIQELLNEWEKTTNFSIAENLVSKGCPEFSKFTSKK